MDFCPKYSKCAWTIEASKRMLFTRLRCGSWDCEFCSKKNASIWRAFLLTRLPQVAGRWFLLTLTAHSRLRSKQGSFSNIRENIDRFMKRIRRVFGAVSYVRVYEKHPSSEAIHAHFLIAGLTPFVVRGQNIKHQTMFLACLTRATRAGFWTINTYIKYLAQDCQMGMIADCSALEGDISIGIHYVAKYLTKSQQELGIAYLRHVQTTSDIGSPKTEGEYKWITGQYITLRDTMGVTGVYDLNTKYDVPSEYWDECTKYPPESV